MKTSYIFSAGGAFIPRSLALFFPRQRDNASGGGWDITTVSAPRRHYFLKEGNIFLETHRVELRWE